MNLKDIDYKRKLQGHERRHMYAPNSIIPIVVRILGDVEKNNIKKAVKMVQQRHVLLRVKLVIDESKTAWFTTEDVDEIPIKIQDRISDDQWISVCKNESRIPFDFYKRPPIRIILLYSNTKSDLVIFCHHMFSDGMSVAYLARDLMTLIGSPDKELEILPPPPLLTRENIPDDVSDNVIVQKFINRINRKWKSEEIAFDYKDYLSIFNTYWKQNTHSIELIELSKKQTDSLVKKCRDEQVTVNSLIFSSFLKAQNEANNYSKPKTQKAGVAVDVRNHLKTPASDSFGFYAAGFIDDYKFINHIDFWEFTRKIHKRISKKLSNNEFFINLLRAAHLEPSIHDALIMKTYGNLVQKESSRYEKLHSFSKRKDSVSSMAKKFGAMHFGFAVTNLGRLDFPQFYSDLELDRILVFPPTGPTIETTIFVATVCGKLTLVMSYVEEVMEKEIMHKIKIELEKHLLSIN